MNEKIELPFSCPMSRLEGRNNHVWVKELNSEWTAKCGWSQTKPYKPEFVDIYRKSTSAECLLKGRFSLFVTGSNDLLVRRKFLSLLEINCKGTRLELQYTFNSAGSLQTFYLTGCVIVSAFGNFANSEESEMDHVMRLSNDMKMLLNPEIPSYADVNLKCGAVTIPAHKSILSARSPVFAAMFANNMKESRENHVDITDIEVSVLRSLLTFIYSAKIGDISISQAPDLLYAAEKYQLHGLKTLCSTYMKNTVAMDNIMSILVLGELYDADLKHFAVNFICDKCEHFSILKNTQEWKALQNEMSSLAFEVLTCLVESKEAKLATKSA